MAMFAKSYSSIISKSEEMFDSHGPNVGSGGKNWLGA